MLILLKLTISEAVYVWTEWSNEAKCIRSCSKPSGTAVYRRKCMKCDGNPCKPADDLYCDGHSDKNELCYVGTQCTGKGTYRGEWTEWSTLQMCPSLDGSCSDKTKISFRRCVLPAAFRSRLMIFRCPEESLTTKVDRCPCEMSVWSEWSEWTICSPPGNGTRTRERVCIRRNSIVCRGVALEESVCPTGVVFSAMGHPRIRKVRRPEYGDEEYIPKRKPPTIWIGPTVGGSTGTILLICCCCIVVLCLCRRKKRDDEVSKARLLPQPQYVMAPGQPLPPGAYAQAPVYHTPPPPPRPPPIQR
ncbi:hypothetical protein LSH36_40g17032 [Paralvinella palmiformis]|uniref:Uncharacterized protein n=1 Tax=Paralvinella palmiformis TaxID=53620 RepID=A0AAD9K7X8_9ANNE|nr:hypothetical protein LSH36_40g17032 [Paralvinella palmiformis]